MAALERALAATEAAARALDPAELGTLGEARAEALREASAGAAARAIGIGEYIEGKAARNRTRARMEEIGQTLAREDIRAMAELRAILGGDEGPPAAPSNALAPTGGERMRAAAVWAVADEGKEEGDR